MYIAALPPHSSDAAEFHFPPGFVQLKISHKVAKHTALLPNVHQRRGVQELGVQNIDECRPWYKNDFGARGTSAGGVQK